MKGLGNRIRQAIVLRGTTMHAVEVAAGMSRGHLARVVTGAREDLRASTIVGIADHLDVSCEWLLRGEGPIERSAIPRWTGPRRDEPSAAPSAPMAELVAELDAQAERIAKRPSASAVKKQPARR